MSKLSDIISNFEQKRLKSKLNDALKMIRTGNTSELVEKFRKIDKSKVDKLITEMKNPENFSQLEQLKQDIGDKITQSDFDTLRKSLTNDESALIDKIQKIIK